MKGGIISNHRATSHIELSLSRGGNRQAPQHTQTPWNIVFTWTLPHQLGVGVRTAQCVVRFVNGSSSSQQSNTMRRQRLLSLGFSILQIVAVISWKKVHGGLSCIMTVTLEVWRCIGTTISESAVVIIQVNARHSYSTTSIQSISIQSRVIKARGLSGFNVVTIFYSQLYLNDCDSCKPMQQIVRGERERERECVCVRSLMSQYILRSNSIYDTNHYRSKAVALEQRKRVLY